MKPEPLKNKKREMCSCDEHMKDMDYNYYYWQGDIKSAIKWFKEKMAGSLDNKNFKICLDGINKAFEDVKNQKEGE